MSRTTKIPISRWNGEDIVISSDDLAQESLIVLRYNDSLVANLLGTPADIGELLLGHLICEGLLPIDTDIPSEDSLVVEESLGSYSVSLKAQPELINPKDSERIVTSSCGACNSDDLELLISHLPMIERDSHSLDFKLLNQCFNEMKSRQLAFHSTGGMHAAGITDSDYNLLFVMEDIGRHNAVDKVIGKSLKEGIDLSKSFLLLSGRCGWDIVAKASRSGVKNIASIGACSSLAAKAARHTGVRIVSFLKPDNAVIIGHN